MLKIAINGAAGRMGQRLITLLSESNDLTLAAALEAEHHAALGRDAGEVAGVGTLGVPITAKLEGGVDVLIDFSLPESTAARLKECAARNCAAVVGTTGLSPEQMHILKAAAERVPCVWAPNMSVGVNVLAKLVKEASALLGPDFDIEVIEAHHRFKKDAPSGTAIKLARAAAEGRGRKYEDVAVNGREGITGERTRDEIGMHAVRAGDIVGEHTVLFGSLGEHIELRHVAHSRDTFARGALRAARFVAGKKPGLYSMEDVLGL